jgi:hypothetical protein
VLNGTIAEKGVLAPMNSKINDPLMKELKDVSHISYAQVHSVNLVLSRNMAFTASRRLSSREAGHGHKISRNGLNLIFTILLAFPARAFGSKSVRRDFAFIVFLWPILDRPVQNMNLNKNYTLQG